MKVLLMTLALLSLGASANDCTTLEKCVEHVSKLTGKKYIFTKDFIGGLQASPNTQITAENADILFTRILDINGFTRVPTAVKDTYTIVATRDIRYEALPSIVTDISTPPAVVQNYDFYLMTYNFKNSSQGQVREAANSVRPFMSRFGRIIELKGKGSIIVQESASKLNQIYEVMKSLDRVLSKEEHQAMKEEIKKREIREREEDKREAHMNDKPLPKK